MNTLNLKRLGLPLLGLLVGGAPVLADNVPADRTVTLIRTYNNWAAVHFSPPYENDLNCASTFDNQVAVVDWATDPNKKGMYAVILGAYMTGKPIGLGISGCSSLYGGGVPRIYRVDAPN